METSKFDEKYNTSKRLNRHHLGKTQMFKAKDKEKIVKAVRDR